MKKDYYHLDSGVVYQNQAIDGMYNPSADHAYMVAHGWRYGELPDLTAGYTRIVSGAHQDPDRSDWCILDYMDYSPEAWAAKQRQEKLAAVTPELLQTMSLYRVALRRNFGERAEVNREVGAADVGAYFEAKRVAGTITALENADLDALQYYFPILTAWNGTNETWTLPWEMLPDA